MKQTITLTEELDLLETVHDVYELQTLGIDTGISDGIPYTTINIGQGIGGFAKAEISFPTNKLTYHAFFYDEEATAIGKCKNKFAKEIAYRKERIAERRIELISMRAQYAAQAMEDLEKRSRIYLETACTVVSEERIREIVKKVIEESQPYCHSALDWPVNVEEPKQTLFNRTMALMRRIWPGKQEADLGCEDSCPGGCSECMVLLLGRGDHSGE